MTKRPAQASRRSMMEGLDDLAGLDMILRRDASLDRRTNRVAIRRRRRSAAPSWSPMRALIQFVAKWLA